MALPEVQKEQQPLEGAARARLEGLARAAQADAKTLETRVRAEMSAAVQGLVHCDEVSRIAQDLSDMGELLAEIEVATKEVAAFEKNYKDASGLGIEDNINCVGTPGDANRGKPDPQFETTLKGIDPADVPAAYMAATLTVAKDTIVSASEQLFLAYCERSRGPRDRRTCTPISRTTGKSDDRTTSTQLAHSASAT